MVAKAYGWGCMSGALRPWAFEWRIRGGSEILIALLEAGIRSTTDDFLGHTRRDRSFEKSTTRGMWVLGWS